MPSNRNQNNQSGNKSRSSSSKSELGERLRQGDPKAASELGRKGGQQSHKNS